MKERMTHEYWVWTGTEMTVALLQPDRPTTSSRFKSLSCRPFGPTGFSSQLIEPAALAK
ncbi:hypothetical protein F5877DRAFT_79850 [Lentinula edodes]|nr:hypothetical protein F5877DRAFT_79850 [Lentinula edodes]